MVASVLIVEGDLLVRRLTAETLRTGGFTVADAPTLASAYEQLAADPDEFDVLLVDADLPDGNGFTFAGALRALRFDRPIVVTSKDCRQISRAAVCGASAWLQKPYSRQRLLQMINSAAGMHDMHPQRAIQPPTRAHF